jgi:hypothetical protein
MCGGQPQGTFAQKYKNCEQCKFYKEVKVEEGSGFQFAVVLLGKLTDSMKPNDSALQKSTAKNPERN